VLGAFAYRQMLHLSWIDAFYFCTVTLATVGYGDITPTTDISKLFTIFYILIGIGVFAAFASLLVRNATLRRELRRAKRRQR
jgi:voltage-gated potassium channel